MSTNVPELKTGQMITIAYIIGIVIILYVIYKVLGKIGLVQTKESKEKDKATSEILTNDYFSAEYALKRYYKSLGKDKALEYAETIRKALKGFGTDENQLFITFGKLYSKCNIAEIATIYNKKYGRDLQADIANELSAKEKVQLLNIINSLPN